MARSTVELELIAVVSKAEKTIDRFTKDTKKSLEGISLANNITAINQGFELIGKTAGPVLRKLEEGFALAVEEAIAAEDAIVGLSNALRIQNDFSQTAIEDFEEFAQQIQQVTTFSDEAALSALSLAKSFKATNSEAKDVVRIAADLAARLGIDLQDATFKVAQTLNGFVDKGIAKTIPGLRSLTKEALISGEGLKIIEQNVRGSAEALGNTFSGALAKAKNSFNDVFEEFGKAVIQTPETIGALQSLGAQFGIIAVGTAKLAPQISAIVASILDITLVFAEFGIRATETFVIIRKLINFVNDYAIEVIGNFIKAVYEIVRAIVTLGKTASEAQSAFKTFFSSLNPNNAINKTAKEISKTAKRFDEYADGISKARAEIKKTAELIKSNKTTFENSGLSLTGASARKTKASIEEVRKQIEEASKNPIKTFIDLVINKKIDKEGGIAVGAGIITSVLKGVKGAEDLIASAFGAIGDILLPGIGSAVSEIVRVLSLGPDKVKQLVEEFARSIPQIIQNIIEALPVLIEALARELPPALAKTMPFIAQRFTVELIKNIPLIIRGFAEGMVEAAKAFGQELLNFIKTGGGLFGGGGGDGGGIFSDIPVLGDIGDFFGFAQGGRVPDSQKFAGDRFPARLDAGEQVLSRDLSSKLERFLTGGQSQPLTVNFVLGQQRFARAELDINRRGFRTA